MSIFAPATPTVKTHHVPGCCFCFWWKIIELRPHGVHCHVHLCQLFHDHWVGDGKNCIDMCKSFQILTLCLHFLDDSIQIVYHLVMLFWSWWWYTVDVLYQHCVSPFDCSGDWSPLFTTNLVVKCLEFGPCLQVGGWSSPLSYILVKCGRLCQKGYPFAYHHFVGISMPSCTCGFSSLFQLLFQLDGVSMGTYSSIVFTAFFLRSIFNRPIGGKYML